MSRALTEALRPIVAAASVSDDERETALHALDDIDGRLAALEAAGSKPVTSAKTTRK